uniref:Glycosyltransferase, GT2 family n=1 Tax=Candidatus Kentrum sp. DK TaxID=2126562 RepID=A0A450RV65_9GAMM|nr:MAG: Glycosyltransferase, GT2 family [Candidatus Kentron sp. DK]
MGKFDKEVRLIEESGLFDRSWYLAEYPDVKETGMDPIRHYLWVGAALWRNPGPEFDIRAYLQANPDVKESGTNPLLHYAMTGKAENRSIGSLPGTENPRPIGDGVMEWRNDESIQAGICAREEAAPSPGDAPAFCVSLPGEAIAARAGELAFPPLPDYGAPEVSILIPCFNEIRYTLECLFSVRNALEPGGIRCEVIVFDNGSTDETSRLLPPIPNLVFLREKKNIGFGPANNKAAEVARGEYLLFLNNDAQIAPGTLEALLAAIRNSDVIGAVGPKVIGFDGRLQEAGSHMDANGMPTLIGFGQDTQAPRFNYRREVDCISGAALLMRRDRFLALGGFDPIYAPAYYEDTDLCFRLREKGLQIVYVPDAVVAHHLSVTSGKGKQDQSRLALLTRNRQRFLQRWRRQLLPLNAIRR